MLRRCVRRPAGDRRYARPSQLATVISRMTASASRLVGVDCAYFSADGTRLTQGNFNVNLAARLRLLGREVNLGAGWNFAVTDGSPDRAVMRSSSRCSHRGRRPARTRRRAVTCPPDPRPHTATVSPTSLDEGGVATARVDVRRDGHPLPGGAVRLGRRLVDDDPGRRVAHRDRLPQLRERGESGPSSVTSGSIHAEHHGHGAQRRAGDRDAPRHRPRGARRARRRDAARRVHRSRARPTGTRSWSTGATDAAAACITLAAGARTFAVPHRYDDDGSYRVTVDRQRRRRRHRRPAAWRPRSATSRRSTFMSGRTAATSTRAPR